MDNQQKVTMMVLSVLLSFASCTLPTANFKSPPTEEDLEKAALEERKQ